MILKDILPKIDISDEWGKSYQYFVPQFIQYAKLKVPVHEWDSEIRDQLFRSVNCISSLRMGNFLIIEREIIQKNWNKLIEPLFVIASNQNRFCIEECYMIFRFLKQLTKANRPAASLRFIAAFQPKQLTTTVTWYFLNEIYYLLKETGIEMPENYGGDAIEKSHYIQKVLRKNYPDLNDLELGTYAWRLKDILPELIKNESTTISLSNTKKETMNAPTSSITTESTEPVSADVWTTQQLLNFNLQIPAYQRPYIWGKSNVTQMLTDILNSMEQGIRKYRIGSIILHQSEIDEPYNIVDGQQRISTLCLIKHALADMANSSTSLPSLIYNHQSSLDNISENYLFIKEWLLQLSDKERINEFASYLDSNCEYVVVKISGHDSLSLAFKVFDSQNGRGKSLEAYNLLKAYHLRAMGDADEIKKIECDRKWESNTCYTRTSDNVAYSYDILKHIFDEQLYRTRIWSRNAAALSFSKKHINEFKGMQIDKKHTADFPFKNKQLLLFMTEKFYQSFLKETMPICSRFASGDNKDINPFVTINDTIVDGEFFFNYVKSYAEIYKKLFLELDSYQLYEFKEFYKKYCLNYKGHWRIGDNYIREMYKSMIMLLFDRFGEKGVNEYYRHLYVLSYYKRVQNQRVTYPAIATYPMNIFSIIVNAKDLASLANLNDSVSNLNVTEQAYEFTCFNEVYKQLYNNE